MEWNDLERLLASEAVGAPDTLTEALVRLDDRQRRRLSAPLGKYARDWWRHVETAPVYPSRPVADGRYKPEVADMELMRLAVVGATTAASAVSMWLDREAKRYFSSWPNFPDEREEIASREQAKRLSRVLAARDDAWVLDLFESLAARLRNAARSEWQRFVITKVTELGIDPPVTRDFLDCWIGRYINASGLTYEERLRRLRTDPLLPRMLAGLFSVDGLGHHFEIYLWTDYSKRALPTYLNSLLEHGDIDRGFLIDGCLRRLLRGGRTGDLTPYRKLLENLAPTPTETAERARDFAALLPDAHSAVATVAQKALRTADEAGLLDASHVVEAGDRVLFRPERKLVRDQLSWLDKAIRRHPDSAAELVITAATAFGHESADVQTRAAKLVARHAKSLSDTDQLRVAAMADGLPSAERERLSGVIELAPVEPPPIITPPLEPTRRVDPERITTVAELAERLAGLRAMLRTDPHGENLEAVTVEPVLEALVEFAAGDRQGLTAALRPVLSEPDFITPEWYGGVEIRLLGGVVYAAARAVGDAYPVTIDADILYGRNDPDEPQDRERSTRAARWRKGLARMSGPERILAHRLAEATLHIADQPVPTLLSTPVDAIGRVHPTAVITRIQRAESEGWQPWEFDLQQALLRLPDTPTTDEIALAEKLTSPAGRRLADWLAGRSRPDITVVDRPMVMYDRHGTDDEIALPLTKVAVRQPDSTRTGDVQLLDQLRLSFPRRVLEEDVTVERPDWPRAWSAVLPHRRDVLAAHLARLLGPEAYWDKIQPQDDRYYLSMLPELADADGPADSSLAVCLAFGLNVAGTGDRACVVDAFLTLAARDQLDTETVAATVADLIAAGLGKCTRIATTLREAADSGAPHQVWRILAAALPRLLPLHPTPNRLADLLELASRTAELVTARGEIPTLAETASRRGSSKLVKEARRLHEYLTR